MSGMPYKYTSSTILHNGKSPESYVTDWYSMKRFWLAYGLNIIPILDPDNSLK